MSTATATATAVSRSSSSSSSPSSSTSPVPAPAAAFGGRGVPYLITHHNSPAFRIRVPADLQPCLGKTEYRRSLGRCYASEAKLKTLRLATAALEVFSFAREAIQSRAKLLLSQDENCIQARLGATLEPAIFSAGERIRSTSRLDNREKTIVAQGETTYGHGHTAATAAAGVTATGHLYPYQGRELSSLTDDEIRDIAEKALLTALRGANLLSLAPYRERVILGDDSATEEGETLKNIAIGYGEMMIQGADNLAAVHQKQKAVLQRTLQRGQIRSDTAQATDKILASEGIEANQETETHVALLPVPATASIPYMLTCQEISKAQIVYHDVLAQSAKGNYAPHDVTVSQLEKKQEQRQEKRRIKVQSQAQHPATAAPEAEKEAAAAAAAETIKLSEAIEEMCREKSLDGSWKPKVAAGVRNHLTLFQAIIDPDDTLPVSAIGPKHLSRYKGILHLMPANRGKKGAYRDMSLPALLRLVEAGKVPEELRMENNTIKTYCQNVSAFLNWAERREYHHKSAIARILQVKAKKQPHEYRDPYTDNEISKLFAPDLYLTGTGKGQGDKPSRFWVPLLGLFTGARLEELAQLHTDDIVLVNRQNDVRNVFTPGEGMLAAEQPQQTAARGAAEAIMREAKDNEETLCIFVNEGKPYQRLKTPSSHRYVPLSPVLAHDLGFLTYAATVFKNAEQARSRGDKAPGDGRLFPELNRIKETDNFAHTLSKWFGAYRKKAGVVPQPGRGKKDFHSFRHTVARWCEQNEVPEKSAARLLGHSHDTMTFGRYGTETAAHKLYERISEGYGKYLLSLLDIDSLRASVWTAAAAVAAATTEEN